MKQNGHRDSQIMEILKEAESCIPVPTLCREHGAVRLSTNGAPNTGEWMLP